MMQFTADELSSILKEQRIKPRIIKNLRFNPDPDLNWNDLDIYAVSTRSNAEGVLLIDIGELYVIPYELMTKTQDNTTGQTKPITCDLCFSWQSGSNSARITFTRTSDNHKFTYLCCADLKCSLHVRNLTPQGLLSRTQLHEDINTDDRIARLKMKTYKILQTLNATPLKRN